jgi:MFS family permease
MSPEATLDSLARDSLTRNNLKTPKAAAIAGMLFSVLLIAVFWLLRSSVPADPQEPGAWLGTSARTVALALNLVPFAGIAFLWFIGVLRDRLGQREDRFFATVFLGSGLLFLGMLFAAAALVGGLLIAFAAEPKELINSATYYFARATVYNLVNIYMTKMASVFMISTSTVVIYTGFAPRWLAILGFIVALLVLLGSYHLAWSFVVFPLWVFVFSTFILMENMRGRSGATLRA